MNLTNPLCLSKYERHSGAIDVRPHTSSTDRNCGCRAVQNDAHGVAKKIAEYSPA